MSQRIARLSNLIEAISEKTITITKIKSELKACSDTKEIMNATPDEFVESLEFLNETMFKDAVDFYFEFVGDNIVRIKSGHKNAYMDNIYTVDCVIQSDVSTDSLEKLLRKGGENHGSLSQ